MKIHRRVLQYVAALSLLPLLLTTIQAKPTVSIVQPERDEMLCGKTRIIVDVADAPRVDRVLVYVDLHPEPVCSITAPPFECEFEAGPGYQGRSIRAMAVKKNGTPIALANVVTLGFHSASDPASVPGGCTE